MHAAEVRYLQNTKFTHAECASFDGDLLRDVDLPITLDSISKCYKKNVVLSNISYRFHPGRIYSIIGKSGSGKSTLLRVMANLEQPSSGQVSWWGRDSRILGSSDRKLSMVFQDANLLPWCTIVDNVALPLNLAGECRNSSRLAALEALKKVSLDGIEALYPRQLSGGMRMRVSIARAIVTMPNLLLLDEPFGALDEITRDQLNIDVVRISRELGITVVLVTHSIQEAAFMSDEVIVLSSNPGTIGNIISSHSKDLMFWRSAEDYRLSDEFFNNVRSISKALRLV